eukprot:CAMPEP_0198210688 /NCGR_PEP_ID=MMETSP1445-20131203/21670_1 /TAXON_ID=36898 /ORGANISM="Pyramimonas sp., Strain CCMP2087" /LENGTH=158 /DNA_ID=CAMNT_0043884811 /DNA_START=78 /DNA_END=554 /DNA_ORIENTATION=+
MASITAVSFPCARTSFICVEKGNTFQRALIATPRRARDVVVFAAKDSKPEDSKPKYSATQLEFMQRKQKKEMPTVNACKFCSGHGTCECGVCKGTGMNNEDMDIPDQDQLLHTNAVRPDLYDKQGQCWFCRGSMIVACKECSGTGIVDVASKYMMDMD